MIYNHSTINYVLSLLLLLWTFYRLRFYLRNNFDNFLVFLIPLATFGHPLAIDVFLGPNLVSGALAFYLLIESENFYDFENSFLPLSFLILSSVFNISYLFITLFFIFNKRIFFKRYKNFSIFFFIFSFIFLYKNLIIHFEKSFGFPIYFIQNLLMPVFLTLINYSYYNFPFISFSILILFLIFIVNRHVNKKISWDRKLLFFLPLFGIFFTNWSKKYEPWNDVFFRPSDYLCVTFAFILFLAKHLHRKLFYIYVFLILLTSLSWGKLWFPFSSVLSTSIGDLPEKFSREREAKKILSEQFMREKNIKASKEIDRRL